MSFILNENHPCPDKLLPLCTCSVLSNQSGGYTKRHMYRIFLFALGLFVLCTPHAFASNTDGTADSTDRWAWSENAGWIDFGTTLGNVHVSDSGLTGYAYGENIGWISLNCSNTNTCADNNYAVTNNAEGTLSGYAWSENAGWIDFAPSAGGVTINASGVFSGYAYSENLGWIVFAVDHPVTTDWRHASTRPCVSHCGGSSSRSLGSSSGSSGTSPAVPAIPANPPASPATSTVPTTPPSITPPRTGYAFGQNRRLGNSGPDILLLQKFLNTHGFIIVTTGPGSPGNETNYFGLKTFQALKKFQASVGLPATGYFGPMTRAYIASHY